MLPQRWLPPPGWKIKVEGASKIFNQTHGECVRQPDDDVTSFFSPSAPKKRARATFSQFASETISAPHDRSDFTGRGGILLIKLQFGLRRRQWLQRRPAALSLAHTYNSCCCGELYKFYPSRAAFYLRLYVIVCKRGR
jgi:hypothetical protein